MRNEGLVNGLVIVFEISSLKALIIRVSVSCSIFFVVVDITHGPVKTVCEYHEVCKQYGSFAYG